MWRNEPSKRRTLMERVNNVERGNNVPGGLHCNVVYCSAMIEFTTRKKPKRETRRDMKKARADPTRIHSK